MDFKSAIVEWLSNQLTYLLRQPVNTDMSLYIISIEFEKDFDDYIGELLCESIDTDDCDTFICEVKSRWKSFHSPLPTGVRMPKKDQNEVAANTNEKKFKKKNKKPIEVINLMETDHSEQNTNENEDFMSEIDMGNIHHNGHNGHLEADQEFHKKKKNKFVPLFSEQGTAKTIGAILPGRHPCECQSTKHPLVNNCTDCGRVVCDQEGSGPCLFCGSLVCTKDEFEVLQRGSKKSERLRAELTARGQTSSALQSLEKAIMHKEKLLDYDKNSTKRTQVLDDDLDYFSTDGNSWLSSSDRQKLNTREEELRSKRHASRLDRKVTLDFAGRKVIEEPNFVDMYNANDEVVREVENNVPLSRQNVRMSNNNSSNIVNPNINQEQPLFIESQKDQNSNEYPSKSVTNGSNLFSLFPSETVDKEKKKMSIIQDKEMQEITDNGMCLSMHQPYASLLVNGAKMHEGRTWYSAHRGRLWIAAGAKKALNEEIAHVEKYYYMNQNNVAKLDLPKDYPTGCLLGCVYVEDCLEQREYREKYPNGESTCPFVLICSHPQELVVKFPLQGKHKIYKLDENIHSAAKKGLR